MRVLYYFPELSNPMMQWQRVHIFDELSRHDVKFEIFNPLLFSNIEEANIALVKKIKEEKYDLFLSNLCNDKHLFVESVCEIKKAGVPTLCFRSDNLSIPFYDKVLSKYFDLVWLTSVDTKYLYDKWGATTMFAPYAANPYVYKFSPTKQIRKGVFIGTPYGSRAVMINKLSASGIPIDLYYGKNKNSVEAEDEGKIVPLFSLYADSPAKALFNRIRFKEGRKLLHGAIVDKIRGVEEIKYNESITKSPSVSFSEMTQHYSNYALSLSFSSTEHTDVLRRPLSRTFLRTFEIPMCGGIQFCRYCDEISTYFEDGKEIVMYHDDNELIEKAKYYTEKASDQELLTMKQSARKRSENEHTWMSRFKIAFDKLGLKY